MKLLYITNGIHGSGGLERVLAVKASYLADKLSYNVHILTLNGGGIGLFYEFSANITFHDIKVDGNAFNYIVKYRSGIKKVIKTSKPDVISVCDDGLKGLLFPFLFGKQIPVIYERHASVLLNFEKEKNIFWYRKLKNKFFHSIMVFGAKKFNKFIVLTNGNKKDWPKVNCSVIPNPIPFEIKEDEEYTSEKTVLAVGSQSYNKGYDRLIKTWAIGVGNFPNWRLKIFGKENSSLNLQGIIDENGLSSSIQLNNPISNIQKEYKKASIFVLPSRSEGFGMVLIEAMSFGLPCVSFDCPHGPAGIINDNENGYLVENGDIEGFANRLMQLMEHENLRNELGKKAKIEAKLYAPEFIVPLWDKLFKSLLV